MFQVLDFYKTANGKKVVMAITGLVGIGFVLIHMLGNLQVFVGQEKLDDYAKLLKSSMPILWGARLTLLGAVVLHVVASWQLAGQSEDARPVPYQKKLQKRKSTFASHSMRWTGPLLLMFIIYHLLHFTIGWKTLNLPFIEGAVYSNVVNGFKLWPVSAFYIICMLALSQHLYHGIWSLFQTLGINHPRYNGLIRAVAALGTAVVVIGNISIPVAILAGYIK